MLEHLLKKWRAPAVSLRGLTPLTQLYERGASKKRIRPYRSRWLGWVMAMGVSGVTQATCSRVSGEGLSTLSCINDVGSITSQVKANSASGGNEVFYVDYMNGVPSAIFVPFGTFSYNVIGSDATDQYHGTLGCEGRWSDVGSWLTTPQQ